MSTCAGSRSRTPSIVGRVRTVRNGTRARSSGSTADRNAIGRTKPELARTRMQLEAREAELAAVRDQKAAASTRSDHDIERLEGDV